MVLKSNGPNNGRVWDDGTHTSFSYPLYKDVASRKDLFSGVLARFTPAASITHHGVTERALAELVSGNYFEVLGVKPALGRTLTPDDDRTLGGHPVVVLSYAAFQSRFGGNSGVLNQTVLINGHPMTVVGVAQPGFGGFQAGTTTDFFAPFAMVGQIAPEWKELEDRRSSWIQIVARLQPGVSQQQAQVAINTFYKPILAEELKQMPARSERARQQFLNRSITLLDGSRGHSPLREQFTTPLIALMAMVGLVLLIACANVANLLLARAASRQKEIAIRLSIGASRGRLARQLLVESLTLSVCGGALGVPVAEAVSRSLLAMLPNRDLTQAFDGGLDANVLAFSAGLSVLTGLLFGLAPAHSGDQSRPRLGVEGTGDSHHRGQRPGFFAEGARGGAGGAFAGAADRRRTVRAQPLQSPFDPDRFPYGPCDDVQHRPLVEQLLESAGLPGYDRIQKSISALPGVRATSMSAMPLLAGNYMGMGLTVPGYTPKEGEDGGSLVNLAGPGYMGAVGMPC